MQFRKVYQALLFSIFATIFGFDELILDVLLESNLADSIASTESQKDKKIVSTPCLAEHEMAALSNSVKE